MVNHILKILSKEQPRWLAGKIATTRTHVAYIKVSVYFKNDRGHGAFEPAKHLYAGFVVFRPLNANRLWSPTQAGAECTRTLVTLSGTVGRVIIISS